ncbi:protein of unknown function [Azospirillum baldaniorum]|uniref:Uncharacterized protein n=1 Tax=Azospirillum baldaniorum TaxID=1064539 RepID=A0A9P1NM83_9PROT|nr:protein of unknown function [Azospirillum baldaniorum]
MLSEHGVESTVLPLECDEAACCV